MVYLFSKQGQERFIAVTLNGMAQLKSLTIDRSDDMVTKMRIILVFQYAVLETLSSLSRATFLSIIFTWSP